MNRSTEVLINVAFSEAGLRYEKLFGKQIPFTAPRSGDAGYDLYCAEGLEVRFGPGDIQKIATGIHIEIPEGFVGLILDRSSMAAKQFKISGGVIDASYRGEISVILNDIRQQSIEQAKTWVNNGYYRHIQPGDKIAQLILIPIVTPQIQFADAASLTQTERGAGGFGSTGK